MVIVVLMLTALIGMVGLAVDVGHAFERKQFLQNTATSAAKAGAFVTYANITLYSGRTEAQKDAAAYTTMLHLVNQDGVSVVNTASGSYTAAPSDPCVAGYKPDQVFMRAEYLDRYSQPVIYNSAPLLVGTGVYTSTASQLIAGVKVLDLGTCLPRFFISALGSGAFRASSSAFDGASVAPVLASTPVNTTATNTNTVTPTPSFTATFTPSRTPTVTATPTIGSPTSTPTADTTTQYGIVPYLIYGYADPSSTCPTGSTAMLYSVQSSCRQVGDTVQLVNNSANGWQQNQYASHVDGLTGNPAGVNLHDSSLDGCLDASLLNAATTPGPSVTPGGAATPVSYGAITEDVTSFNQGGVGHCAQPFPAIGSQVIVPVIGNVCKNGSCANGGWTYIIKAFVLVQITRADSANVELDGVILNTIYDPYGIVQPPPTSTPTVTFTATATATATPTNTPVPPTIGPSVTPTISPL